MDKRLLILTVTVCLFLILMEASSALPVYLSPKNSSGDLQINGGFDYAFNLSTDVNCESVVYTQKETVVLDKYGFAVVELDTSTMSDVPTRLCEYRNDTGVLTLRANHSIPDHVARNYFGASMNLTGNVSVEYYFGDGSNLQNVGALSADALTILAKINEAGGIVKGQAVYISGATGDKPQISLANNLMHNSSHLMGVAAEIGDHNEDILVRLAGELIGVDTSSYGEGCRLHLGVNGSMTCAVAQNGSHIHLGFAIKINANSGILLIKPEQYVHALRGVEGLNVEIATGTDNSSTRVNFESNNGTLLGYFDGSGFFNWVIGNALFNNNITATNFNGGNASLDQGWFSRLGDQWREVTKIWAVDIDVSGFVNIGDYVNLSRINIRNGGKGGYIKINDSSDWPGTGYAMIFENLEDLPAGLITHAFVTNENKLIRAFQSGNPFSGSPMGNSQIILPNNFSTNLSLASDCRFVAEFYGVSLHTFCQTSDDGADLIVQGSVQVFRDLIYGRGLRGEGSFLHDAKGGEVNFVDSNFALKNSRSTIIILTGIVNESRNFEGGVITPYMNKAVGNWDVTTDLTFCNDNLCAHSTGGGVENIMFNSENVSNIVNISVSFFPGADNFDPGDYFRMVLDNGTYSEVVYEHNTTGANQDLLPALVNVNVSLFDGADNLTVSLVCFASNPAEECFIDDITWHGNVVGEAQINQTFFDATMHFGTENNEFFFNDTDDLLSWEKNFSASYLSANGTAGYDGTCASATDLVVQNGLIVGCS